MRVPNIAGKVRFPSIYNADDFLRQLRHNNWEPGPLPSGVIFTYGGFDLLCGAQPDEYTMNPMLGPGPGRFFTVTSTGGRVGVDCMGIGAPAVAAQLEVLASLGVREFLSLGTAGGLGPHQSVGDVVVLTDAVRDEGVSYHYLPPDVDVHPDTGLAVALRDGLRRAGLAVTDGTSWTTDAPYRETREELEHYRRQGVLTVEMEAAAVFAVAQKRNVPLASAVVLDCVFGTRSRRHGWIRPQHSESSTTYSSRASTCSRSEPARNKRTSAHLPFCATSEAKGRPKPTPRPRDCAASGYDGESAA